MALPSDVSLMDFILEREDPLLALTEKDLNGKTEFNDSNEINTENWATNADDLLDSMLKFEDPSFEMLNDDLLPDFSMANSSSSDSGLSSDQQMSPRQIEPDDEDIHILNSEDMSQIQSEIEVESSVLSSLDSESIQVENDQAVINVLSVPEQSDVTSVLSNTHNKLSTSNATVLRVTPISGNPRSLLLPVNLKNVRDIKTIKVINLSRASKLEGELTTLPTKVTPMKTDTSEDELNCEGVKSQYPRLQLTNEEKRLLQKEGVRLPTHYPLTKHEERELKRIRRKIRNKISAQDSRKRKKEYIDGLEDRVKQCTEENVQLVKRIKALQTQNQSLTAQLHRLQALVARSTAKSVQPATCLMVLLLSLALVMAPNLRPGAKPDISDLAEISPSRSLLFCKTSIGEEGCHLGKEELENVIHTRLEDHDYGPPASKYARIIPERTVPSTPDVHPESAGPGPGIADNIIMNEPFSHELRVNISDKGGPRTVTLQVPAEK
ncbi:Cyclic AMP response element-binding protein A [Gryllus bimaculatus]|nr:Cyclic AMP response element-binding protein A [Gryllus bimaculatus]